MKYINKILSSGLLLLFCSCNSWLDIEQIDQTEESRLFSSERGFTEALAGVYSKMSQTGLYGQDLSYGMLEIMAQTYDYSQVMNDLKIYRDYNYEDAKMQEKIASVWLSLYSTIASANNIILWCDKTGGVMDEQRRNQVKGEALAIRAYLHYDVYRLFAPNVKRDQEAELLPFQQTFGVDQPQIYRTREFLSLVVNDLKQAAELLRQDPILNTVPYKLVNNTEEGENKDEADKYVARMNFFAVNALLARVYLDLGGEWKKEARKLAEDVIASQKFRLLNYEQSLNVEEKKRDILFSDEHIFSLRNVKIKDVAKDQFKTSLSPNGNLQMSTAYKMAFFDGENTDYRLAWFKEVFVIKYNIDNSKLFSPKVPMIKLSEMYLIAAEGWLEDDPDHALELLNTLRKQRMAAHANVGKITPEALFKEYRREFICEGQFFFTCKRLHHNIPGNTGTQDVVANEQVFVFPLPDSETTNRIY